MQSDVECLLQLGWHRLDQVLEKRLVGLYLSDDVQHPEAFRIGRLDRLSEERLCDYVYYPWNI